MKFLVDAQLPRRFATWLRDQGHDAVHTLDLPDGNRTTDGAITSLSVSANRIVVTKDADLVESFILRREPEKLLLISAGNITDTDLELLLLANLSAIIEAFAAADFVELSRTGLIIHG